MSLWPVALAALAALPLVKELRRRPVSGREGADLAGAFAELPRGRVYYRWHGPKDGSVAVCVHGLTTPSYVWDGLIPLLTEKGFRVLSFDLYGRGLSDRPRGLQDVGFFEELLNELLTHLKVISPITLIGNSMGSAIATSYAARHSERIRQLVLFVPAGMGHDLGTGARLTQNLPVLGDWLFHMIFPRDLRQGAEAERGMPSTVADITNRQLDELRWQGFLRSVLSSLRGTLSKERRNEHCKLFAQGIPTLAIWGGLDDVIPIACKDRMAGWNPDARHIVLPEAGHGLVYTHTAELWRQLDKAFLPQSE